MLASFLSVSSRMLAHRYRTAGDFAGGSLPLLAGWTWQTRLCVACEDGPKAHCHAVPNPSAALCSVGRRKAVGHMRVKKLVLGPSDLQSNEDLDHELLFQDFERSKIELLRDLLTR